MRRRAKRVGGGRRRQICIDLPREVLPLAEIAAKLQGRPLDDFIRELVVDKFKDVLMLTELVALRRPY